jgi:type I restriction enzyme, S subunit
MNWPTQPISSLGTVQSGSTPSTGHPTNWPVFSLGNVCSVRRGTTITQNQAKPGAIPVVPGGLAATYFHDIPNREGNVITVSASGASAGFVNYWVTPIFASYCSTIESESPDVSIKYIFHFLRGKQEYIYSKLRSGAAQPHVYAKDIAALEVLLPPLPEQRRIAAILDSADAIRVKRREALAQLDSLTQSIFIEMFGDPVSNPKRWIAMKVGNLLAFQQYGPRFYNETYTEKGIPIIRITDLAEDGSLDFSNMPRLSVSREDIEKYSLKAGDIIFARTGATVGKIALIQTGMPVCIAGAYFITMRFIESIVPLYARFVLTAKSIREIVQKRSRQAAQQNFSGPGLRDLPMPLPPIHLQHEFARRVESIERLKGIQRAALAELDALFASLQYRAFRGEL